MIPHFHNVRPFRGSAFAALLVAAVLLPGLLTSCRKETAGGESGDGGRILFSAGLGAATRAAASLDEEDIRDGGFRALAFTDGPALLFNEKCVCVDKAGTFEPEGGPWTWPVGKCDFYGICPFSVVPDVEEDGSVRIAYDASVHEDGDILAARAAGRSRYDGCIPMEFRHVLARTKASVVSDDGERTYVLTDMSLLTAASGTYDCVGDAWDAEEELSREVILCRDTLLTLAGGTGTDYSDVGGTHNVCPGVVKVRVAWKVKESSGEERSYDAESAPVTVNPGEETEIIVRLSDSDRGLLRFTVEVGEWSTVENTFEFE